MMYHCALATLVALAACGEGAVTLPLPESSSETQASHSAAPPEPAEPRTYAVAPPPGKELPPSQTTPGPVPLDFRHVWAIEIADCKREPGLTRIAIAPGAVKFYEGRSEVVSLEQNGAREVIMQVKHAAEGRSDNEIHTLKLNDAGTTLTYGRGGSTYTYTRCD